MNIETIQQALLTLPLGGLRVFDSIGSTNDEALAWADAGCPDFSLVIADEQTMGRGRFARKWITRRGSSLAFSLILKPLPIEIRHLSLFAPMAGLAVWQALSDLYQIQTQIKWPNDVLINRQKCAGILVETAWNGNDLNGVVLGIGINISSESIPPTTDQLFPATCIETALGYPVERFELLASVLHSIQYWRKSLVQNDFISAWQSHLAFVGEKVEIVQSPKPPIIGVIKEIDPQGRLVITQAGNSEIAVEAGDVHLRLANNLPVAKEK